MSGSRTRPHRSTPGGRTRKWIGALLFVGAGVLAGALFFHLVVMPWFVRHGSDAEVPDLQGLTNREAKETLDRAGLKQGTVAEASHDRVEAGRILRQAPPPGFRVKKGRAVDWVVSLGPQALRVPALEGESIVHARFLLQQAGLQSGEVETTHSDEILPEHVIASNPRPGEAVAERERVDLLVSLGPAPQRFVMPDLRGEDPDKAASYLERAGFRVEQRYWPGAKSEWPRVAEQDPPPGYPIQEGETVRLFMGE